MNGMGNGSITLGAVSARTSHLEVACTRCERHGRYSLPKLVASLGEEFPLTDLGSQISDCPKKNAAVWERCDIYYPGLRAIMTGDKP
jgi:hypothetical protein